jgi:hypothetical protein
MIPKSQYRKTKSMPCSESMDYRLCKSQSKLKLALSEMLFMMDLICLIHLLLMRHVLEEEHVAPPP